MLELPLATLSAAWTFLASPIGRILIVAALAFIGGWEAKARLDEGATLRALIARQRIDLRAAQDAAADSDKRSEELNTLDAANQETIRDLRDKLSRQPASAVCRLDPDAALRLRRLR